MVERACAERAVPSPPIGLEPWKSKDGDMVFDLDHLVHPVRWRFAKNGDLLAFIVYRPTVFQSKRHRTGPVMTWTPIWDAAEKRAVCVSVLGTEHAA